MTDTDVYFPHAYVTRQYVDYRQEAINSINEAALTLLQASSIDTIKLGGDWRILKKQNSDTLYLESDELNLFCKIEGNVSARGSDKRKYINFHLKSRLVIVEDDGPDYDKELPFDLTKNKIEDLFKYSSSSFSIPFKIMTSISEEETEEEKKELLAKAYVKYPELAAIAEEENDYTLLQRLISGKSLVDVEMPYEFTAHHLYLSICSKMLGLSLDTYSLFKLDKNEEEMFGEEKIGKNFSAGFDYLFDTLKQCGYTNEDNILNFNASDDNIYLKTVASHPIMCSTSQNGGWITIKGDKPGSWQCYNILEPFDTAEKLMALGPKVLKPSLIIENYEIVLLDSFAHYCQYAIWGAIREIRQELVARKLLPENSQTETEMFIPEMVETIEVLREKQKLEKQIKKSPTSKNLKHGNPQKL